MLIFIKKIHVFFLIKTHLKFIQKNTKKKTYINKLKLLFSQIGRQRRNHHIGNHEYENYEYIKKKYNKKTNKIMKYNKK